MSVCAKTISCLSTVCKISIFQLYLLSLAPSLAVAIPVQPPAFSERATTWLCATPCCPKGAGSSLKLWLDLTSRCYYFSQGSVCMEQRFARSLLEVEENAWCAWYAWGGCLDGMGGEGRAGGVTVTRALFMYIDKPWHLLCTEKKRKKLTATDKMSPHKDFTKLVYSHAHRCFEQISILCVDNKSII